MVNIKMVGQRFVALSCLILGLSVSVNYAKSAAEEPDFQSILQEALNKLTMTTLITSLSESRLPGRV